MERVLRKPDVEGLVGLTARHLSALERDGLFPKRFTLIPGGRAVGWLESEVQAWLAERAASREVTAE
jgi:prophage regulatory protein